MFFFTNLHGDYHRPSDTWEKINYQGEQNIVSYVVRVASDIADVTEKPIFTKAQSTGMMAGGDRSGVRVSLGIMPDYSEDAPGLKITGTREGSAAEKAGLKGGDVITRFGGKEIKNIYDFMYLLGNYKPGDDVQIVVKRGTEEITLSAKLEGRK
jgi:S1-C subfamily serine protease